MHSPQRIRPLLLFVTVTVAGASAWGYGTGRLGFLTGPSGTRNLAEKYEFAPVSRSVLAGSLTASGRLESSKRTVIECGLENITIGIQGRALSARGASTLLTVVPDGSQVKAGDVLATLDSSSYEELLRQHRMTVERSRADHHQADLDLQVAKLAVSEFQEGVMAETLKDHQRLIALAESEFNRSEGRLEWAGRMHDKGYVSKSSLATEAQTHSRAKIVLDRAIRARDVFIQYSSQKTLRQLEGVVQSRQATVNYQDIRLQRNLERLAKLEKQVELCTIRAPHDGYIIYANDPRRGIVIEPGIEVRQKQSLFYLPDLTKMEVVAMLHESVVDQVSHGMEAQIAFEGAANFMVTGRVRSIAPLPIFQDRSDVRYFEGIVSIDEMGERELMPGMTARVDLQMPPKSNVLTVPVEAVTSEDGSDYCYVAREGGEGLEKRRIELGQASHDVLEIAGGLEEGEQVVLNPRREEVAGDLTESAVDVFQEEAVEVDPTAGAIAALR